VRSGSSRLRVQIVTLCLATLTCSGLGAASTAAASDDLRVCMDRALEGAKQRGAKVDAVARTDFLLTGDARVHVHRYTSRACLGFVAAGAKFAQAIDLTVLAPSGRVLARGAPRTTLPYAVHCGKPGDVAFVSVRMTDGQGEVAYAALTDARPVLSDLARCAALGAPRPAALELGSEPTARPLEDELTALGSELAEAGYIPDGLVAFGALLSGQHEARLIALDAQRCYALAAIGDSDVIDLDLRVFAQGVAPKPLSADTSRRRNALVKLCTDDRTRHVLDTAVFQGEGGYVVQAFRLTEPEHAPGIDGQARLSYGEQSARMLARGFRPEPVTTGLVAPNERLRVPMPVEAGRCYAFGAVALADSPRGALDLGVLDPQGKLAALDTGTHEDPLVFYCASAPGVASVLVRAKDTRGSARFALLVGNEPDSGVRRETP
jgi:hypothetical protein